MSAEPGRGEALGPLLWRFGSRRAPRTFVLAPYAGGGPFSFAEWIPHLITADDAAIVLNYPGRRPDDRKRGERSLASLAAGAAAAGADVAAGPLVVIGHSMGGLIAHEMAL